jgi:cytochrome c553
MDRPTPDSAVADAMNRVLAAEREAADAIASGQRAAEAMIEAARARRRQVLDTARRRSSALHVRAQTYLQQALQDLERGDSGNLADPARLRSLSREAIERIARRLTSIDHEPD